MHIKYTGPVGIIKKRTMSGIEWNQDNGFEVDVTDPELVLNLITHGPDDFAVALDDPLLTLVGSDDIGALVLAGIISPDALSDLKADELKALAAKAGLPESKLKAWAKQAKTGAPNEAAEEE